MIELHCSSVSWLESPVEPFVTHLYAVVVLSRTSMMNFMPRHLSFLRWVAQHLLRLSYRRLTAGHRVVRKFKRSLANLKI
jgi:hypothetical protein